MPNRREFIQSVGAAVTGVWGSDEPDLEFRLVFDKQRPQGRIRELRKTVKRAFWDAGITDIEVVTATTDVPDFDGAKDAAEWTARKFNRSYDSTCLCINASGWEYGGFGYYYHPFAAANVGDDVTTEWAKHVVLHEIGHNLNLKHYQADTLSTERVVGVTPGKGRRGEGYEVHTAEMEEFTIMRTRPEHNTYSLTFSEESKAQLQRRY